MTTNSHPLGSEQRPLRAVVVGSGPSGFYAAEALLRAQGARVEVDMLDRLPTPYGLVRGGVAPDHQKIKSVTQVYAKLAAQPAFRFFGNVQLGRDVQVEDLRRLYDCVVYAVGNESDRRLDIPGEDLQGSHPATAFVGWYNGHPDYRSCAFDLSAERAVVVGIGNVAMDVARVLAQDPDRLAGTDIAAHALEALRRSRVREVVLLGRRGPGQAAFSPAEIMEIGELESSDLVIDPKDMEPDPVTLKALEEKPDPEAIKILDYLGKQALKGEGSKTRKVRLRFLASPVEILGEGGRMRAVRVERNELARGADGSIKAKPAGRFETLEAGLILRSVGYHGVAIPGVPFDPKLGRIPNDAGRVIDPAARRPLPGEYVVGWAKRGPTGLIGTNRADSVATVQLILADVGARAAFFFPAEPTREAAEAFLRSRQSRLVTFEDWKRLDRLELDNGAKRGKVREKFTRVEDMLAALGK